MTNSHTPNALKKEKTFETTSSVITNKTMLSPILKTVPEAVTHREKTKTFKEERRKPNYYIEKYEAFTKDS